MTNLEVVNIPLEGDFVSLEMGSKTAEGDKVECPIGLSFACSDGVFKSNSSQVISGSLKFPNWRMQVSSQRHIILHVHSRTSQNLRIQSCELHWHC